MTDGPVDEPGDDAALVAATERWFLRRGTPHLIEDYRAGDDVFTRTLPVLWLVVLVEVLGVVNLQWRWWQNTLALVGGAALLVGLWGLVNRARGRPPLARPDHVGPVELVAFVVLPALLPLVFGGQMGSAAAVAAVNLTILALVYLVTGYGLVPMTRWALGQTLRQLGAVVDLFGRALPLLLLFSVALFVNAEMWQVAGALDGALFAVTISFFVLLGLGFLLLRLPAELQALRDQLAGPAVVEACAGSPLEATAADVGRECDLEPSPLSRRQQGNLLLVLLFSQAVQVALVALSIGTFFGVFGLVAIRPEVVTSWLGGAVDPTVWASWTWFGRELVVTRALVQVAVFLGALSGFTFTVYVITDSTYREEFFTEVVGQVRQSLAVRTVYLEVLRRRSPEH